jgi:basic membrane protein A and related proteins
LKKSLKVTGVVAAATLAFAGLALAPASQAAMPKVCLALDTGGIDDHSFNASAWAGAQSVKSIANVSYVVADANNPDYTGEVNSLVNNKCNLIIGVGFLITPAIDAAAQKNPTINFAQVDDPGLVNGKALPNLRGLTFATNQSAFEAGYLAAGFSKTGTVATYGGINIPPVTIYMDGFAKGAAYYAKMNKKTIKVLGWDPADPKSGVFVGDFSSQNKALQISKNFEQQGADVIFPVAGGLELATAQNSAASHKSVVIGVDSDAYGQYANLGSVFLNSALKGVGASVAATIKDQAAGKFNNTQYVGTLANGGTGLAGYHALAAKVPGSLQNAVRALGKAIAAGTVSAN